MGQELWVALAVDERVEAWMVGLWRRLSLKGLLLLIVAALPIALASVLDLQHPFLAISPSLGKQR